MKSRKSRQLEDTLHDYVAGDLDESAAAEVEERLTHDPEARALCDKVRAAHDALASLRERPAPPVAASDVLPAIQAAIAADRFQTRPHLPLEGQGTRFYRRLAVAAMLLCAVSLSILALSGSPAETIVIENPDRPPIEDRIRLPMSAAEYLQLLEEEGVQPQDLTVTFEDQVVPVALDSAQTR